MKAKRKRFFTELAVVAAQSVLLVGIAVMSVFPMSCRVTSEGIEIVGGDYAAPVLENFFVVDDMTVEARFSEAVEISDVVISPVINGVSDSYEHSENENLSMALAAACGMRGKIEAAVERSNDGRVFTFRFCENTKVGKSYELFGVVHDEIGNSLTFCVPFIGFNSEVPKIIMTEIQAKYAKASLKTGVVYRSEYVEFLALNDGNLAGIELISASDGEAKKYEFPPVEVEKGQIFLVHLRTIGDGCINEGEDFDEATAEFACNGILDLWSENTAARFNDGSDVIILRNSINDSIMDGVMYIADSETDWKTGVGDYALMLENCGIYESENIENASSSKGMTPKKSLQRVDSLSIFESLQNGIEIDYPVIVNSESWIVDETTPGVL